ncbi:hypothetical protein [Archangium sp.]|uniref:hypothetical protein n=1 Tax=Archangium sp. TaxID=1872627 RepID=UPI00286B4841|nr:hypothetical protein [Archangium sp.]
METPVDVALRVARTFEKLGLGYFLGGSFASSIQGEFSRRRALELRPGESIVVKSPEDTVLRKLLWFQEGGGVSDRQWRDIVQVLRVSGASMDVTYLEQWAERLDVADLLARARAEATHGRPT